MTRRRGPADMGLAPSLPPSSPASSDQPMAFGDMMALAAWTVDPVGWIREWLGCSLWSRQEEIAEALVDYREVDVVTGHGIGKDYLAARLALWWLFTRPGAIVLTTSAKEKQVVYVLWGELRQAYANAKAPLGGILAPVAPELRLGPKQYAIGMVAKDTNAMAGFHEEHVLVIEDEAAGVGSAADEALMGCAGTDTSRVLRIGNPTCGPTHQFAKSCGRPNIPGRHVTIRIPTTDTPNYKESRDVVPGLQGRAYVEAMLSKYGKESAIYKARVEAIFPSAASNGFVSFDHVNDSRMRLESMGDALDQPLPKRIGCDVARFGDDLTVVWIVQGPYAWIPPGGIISKADGRVVARYLVDLANAENASSIAFDKGGIGAGVEDSLNELVDNGILSPDVEVCPNDFGSKATDPAEFADRRTELWGGMRDWLKDEARLDPDELLEEELLSPTFKFAGRAVRLEPKESVKDRLKRSPDRADGLALAVCGHLGNLDAAPRLTVW